MNEPGPHCGLCDGSTERIFSPTSNIHIPMAFQHTWSDFHDETEKELAHMYPDLEPANRVASRPSGKLVREQQERQELEAVFTDELKRQEAIFSANGWDTDGF